VTSTLEGVCGQHHSPAVLPREIPGTHCTEEWVGPMAGLGVCEKSRLYRDFFRSPDRSVRSQSLYRLSYPAQLRYSIFFKCLLTSMFHYNIAILHGKSFLLQPPVTPINTVYIHCLTESGFFVKVPFTKCFYVRFLLLKIYC
jgi:hypothetical protein